AEPLGRRLRDQEPAVVGAKIERGIGRVPARAVGWPPAPTTDMPIAAIYAMRGLVVHAIPFCRATAVFRRKSGKKCTSRPSRASLQFPGYEPCRPALVAVNQVQYVSAAKALRDRR